MRLAPWVLGFALGSHWSCGLVAPSGPLNVQVVVGVGEGVDVRGTSIRLVFRGVRGDSRCPADAICIQGGDAIVRIDIQSVVGPDITHDLHTGNMQPVRHGDLTITLVELQPYPFTSRPIDPDEYRATFQITR